MRRRVAAPAARGVRYDGLTGAALLARLGKGPLVLLATTRSTLDVAHRLGASGAPSGAVVLADAQTAGRGRHGRRWQSPRAAGIWLTVLLRPRRPPVGGALAVRAGLATVDALAAVLPVRPRLKWPNDIMIADRKAGGILCEARWSGPRLDWIAVGVGLNVRGPVPRGLRGTAIALDEIAPSLERVDVLAALVPGLRALERTGGPLRASERARFLAVAWREPAEDIADLTPDGALVVRRADGSLDRRSEPA